MITQENIPYTADEIKAMVKTCEKYNKALERAQKMQENSNGMILKKWLWGVFPEVKESEDERIRKEIIRILKGKTGYTSKEDTDKYVAWLEKQGEQKYLIAEIKNRKALLGAEKEKAVSSTDKLSFGARIAMLDELLAWVKKQGEEKPTDEVEPKFKVGDWVIQENIGTYKVIEVCESWYEVIDNQNNHYSIGFDKEDMCHLWTIQDAKDGDVLDCEGCEYLLFKSFSNTDGRIKLYCWYNVQTNNFHDRGTDSKLRQEANIHPATKEQRDWLFSKMKEAGYEWDANKKELKKIGPKKLDANKVINWVNPDKVIEWLKITINERAVYNETHLTLPYNSIEDLINDFKEDFGL